MRVKMLHAVVTTGFATPANIHPRIALRQLPHFTRPLSSATPAAFETSHAQTPRAPSATSERSDGQPRAARSADSSASYGGGGGGGGRVGEGGGGGGRGDGGKQNWNRARGGGGGGSPPSDLFGHQIGREGRRFGQPIVERKGRTIDERKGGNSSAPPPPFPRRKGPGGRGPADGASRGRKEAESFRQERLGGKGYIDGSDSEEEEDDDVYDDMDDLADMEADLLPGIPRNPLPRSARERGFGGSAGAGAAAGAGIGGMPGVAEAEETAEGDPGAGVSWIMNDVDMDDLSMFAPVSLKSAVLDPAVLNLSPTGFEPSPPVSSSASSNGRVNGGRWTGETSGVGEGAKRQSRQGSQSQQGTGMLKTARVETPAGALAKEGEGEEGEGERLVPEQWWWVQEEVSKTKKERKMERLDEERRLAQAKVAARHANAAAAAGGAAGGAGVGAAASGGAVAAVAGGAAWLGAAGALGNGARMGVVGSGARAGKEERRVGGRGEDDEEEEEEDWDWLEDALEETVPDDLGKRAAAAAAVAAAATAAAAATVPSTTPAAEEGATAAVAAAEGLKQRAPAATNVVMTSSPKWVSLHTMAATGQTPFVSHLLASGAAVDALDADGTTALQHAVAGGRLAMAKLLLRHGASLEIRDQHGATLLHHAVRTGNVEMARLLLQKGADVNAADQWGWTPMHVAAQSGRLEMVRALLVLGGKARVQAQDGRTPLDIAQAYGPAHGLYSVVEMLRRPPKLPPRSSKKH